MTNPASSTTPPTSEPRVSAAVHPAVAAWEKPSTIANGAAQASTAPGQSIRGLPAGRPPRMTAGPGRRRPGADSVHTRTRTASFGNDGCHARNARHRPGTWPEVGGPKVRGVRISGDLLGITELGRVPRYGDPPNGITPHFAL